MGTDLNSDLSGEAQPNVSGKLSFDSHPGKPLEGHLQRVAVATRKRGASAAAEIAALFHDLGKINPNFQAMLKSGKRENYTSHAYLSAYTWLCFWRDNRPLAESWIGKSPELVFSIGALIARHHGNLPDMENGFLNKEECKRLQEFLQSKPYLPISEFLNKHVGRPHHAFTLFREEREEDYLLFKFSLDYQRVISRIESPLDFFLDTQFGFASLIESDKRDAAGFTAPDDYLRQTRGATFNPHFEPRLVQFLNAFSQPPITPLNALRTEIRADAVAAIHQPLAEGKRVFTLAAPTGSGKTVMLLALANEILKRYSTLGILYALPFLSITEQVEKICRVIFQDEDSIARIDSKSINKTIERLQRELDEQKDTGYKSVLEELFKESFSEATFDYPFIITTFVQLFESLVSNHNSTLLKLPNFAKTIFLIDEVQALPPRLYIFFSAFLDAFCRKFDSYAILSTATMPHLEIPDKATKSDATNPKRLFSQYSSPVSLLHGESYFAKPLFNRYRIEFIKDDPFTLEKLAHHIAAQPEPCLVILNTIADTVALYEYFQKEYPEEVFERDFILLNTHFTPHDRIDKINACRDRLKRNTEETPGAVKEKFVLISTQLIEAGVDVDFPKLYRDMCPLPSLIQSAGRCNRNGQLSLGTVFFFELQRDDGKIPSTFIYRNEAKEFLKFCKQHLQQSVTEAELFNVQKLFFEQVIAQSLEIGLHKQEGGDIQMIECINRAAFETLGKFRLIEEHEERRFYVLDDGKFEEMERLYVDKEQAREWSDKRLYQLRLSTLMKQMSNFIVTVRCRKGMTLPPSTEEVLGISKLTDTSAYSSQFGLRLGGVENCMI